MIQWVDRVSESGSPVPHPLRYGFIYGIVLGLSLMTRLTNAVGICMASLVIAIYLLKKGEWRNILGSFIAFAGGFLLVTLPFVIYFYKNDALYDMWYGTFLYNAEYAGNSGFNVTSFKGLANIILRFENCYFLLIVSVLMFLMNSPRKFAGILWLSMSALCMVWFLMSNGYGHYVTICLPFPCIALIELHRLYAAKKDALTRWTYRSGTIGYSAIVFAGAIYVLWLFNHMYRDNTELESFRTMMKDVPSDYKQSFAAYNCNADWYLYEDIHPYYPFFVFQDFQTGMGKSLLPKVRQKFSGDAEWLLVKGEKTKIDDIIKARYEFVKKNGDLKLYRLRQESVHFQ
jgi:hypothetical protein